MKQIVIVTERTDGIQCVYVDGVLRLADDQIYAGELVEFCDSNGVIITAMYADLPENWSFEWPDQLSELIRIQEELSR